MKDELYSLATEYQATYPLLGEIQPTRLGNILRAGEACVTSRYGLDPKPLWPLMTQLLPSETMQKIDDSFNQLSFLIYSSFLSLTLSIICAVGLFDGSIQIL